MLAAMKLSAAVIAIAATVGAGGALAQSSPAGAPPPGDRSVCTECGVVQSVQQHETEGHASGVGAVAGGVLGGVLGHQIGSGRGNTVATIAGAGAGAYAGHQVEKNRSKKVYWTVALRMDDGRSRTFTYSTRPTVREGEHVKLVDGGKRLALLAN